MVAGYSTKGDAYIAEKPRVWSDKPRIAVTNKRDFDLALDGTRMMVVLDPRRQETGSSDSASSSAAPTHVNLLLNFFDEIKRRAPERK